MGGVDSLITEVTLKDGKTVRVVTEAPEFGIDDPYRVYVETPSDEATVVLGGLTSEDMTALVHRAVVHDLIKEDNA